MNDYRRVWATWYLVSVVGVACLPSFVFGQELPSAFNGTNLDGWRVPAENIWWKVQDGMLMAKSDPQRTGSILWTDREYANFIIECEYKCDEGIVDSGIFLRNSEEQIQIGISGSLKRDMTGSPYISGKGYPVEAQGVADLLRSDDWNTLTIVAKGKNYAVWLNKRPVLSYDSETATEKGPLGLQLHPGNEMTISFRNIRIAELD